MISPRSYWNWFCDFYSRYMNGDLRDLFLKNIWPIWKKTTLDCIHHFKYFWIYTFCLVIEFYVISHSSTSFWNWWMRSCRSTGIYRWRCRKREPNRCHGLGLSCHGNRLHSWSTFWVTTHWWKSPYNLIYICICTLIEPFKYTFFSSKKYQNQ